MKTYKSLRPLGYGLVMPALLSALLLACSGSAEDETTSKSATAGDITTTSQNSATSDSLDQHTNAISAEANSTPQTFLMVGAADGFVASQMEQSLSKGSESQYDVMVVGRNLATEATTQTSIQKALNNGKIVIVDGNPDGSTSQESAKALAAITGVTVESDAYMLQANKENNGYILTPIDSPKTLSAQQGSIMAQSGTTTTAKSLDMNASASNNSLSNILGLKAGK
jgi:hypothetical protein